jgi:hypothetical protein
MPIEPPRSFGREAQNPQPGHPDAESGRDGFVRVNYRSDCDISHDLRARPLQLMREWGAAHFGHCAYVELPRA